MIKYLVVILCIAVLTISATQSNTIKPVFGVQVAITANSKINSFVCYIDNGTTLTKKKIVDEETFYRIVSGKWPSIYNPERRNYFDENKIQFKIAIDSNTLKEAFFCSPVDSLWKIRFSTYPFIDRSGAGWSNKYFKPSPGQEKYLFEEYNVRSVDTDYFLGDNFWKILRDVVDKEWILNYKSIR